MDEGIARSTADIDIVWAYGYGFPAVRGGPMRYLEDFGASNVPAAIRSFAEGDPAFWRPASLLESWAGRSLS